MSILVDRSQAPIFVTIEEGVSSDADWREHLQNLTTILDRAMPFAFVTDTTHSAGMPSAYQRAMLADWMRLHEPRIKSFCRGGAFVFPSPAMRGLITAIHWIAPPAYPFATFATRAEAVAWCRAKLDRSRTGMAI